MKALKNAKHLENQNKQKFNQLQLQIQALMEKEKKLQLKNTMLQSKYYNIIITYMYIY